MRPARVLQMMAEETDTSLDCARQVWLTEPPMGCA
jgi:hypothetical protein